jgi:predicted neuraminidase
VETARHHDVTALRTDGTVRARADETGRSDAFLPAPAVQNHAANLTFLPDGSLGCVWFAGSQEGVPDISVWFSRLESGSDTWTAPVRLSDDPGRSEQNPLLFPAPDGTIWLLYTAQRAGNQDTAEVRVRLSADGGTTWSAPRVLFPAGELGGVFIRQPIVVLESGRWLLPIFRCVTTPGVKWAGDHDTSSVMISDDDGATWRERPVPESTGCVHMNIHPADGVLVALFRSRWADFVYRSESRDGGETWSAPAPTVLPNNNSSIQFIPITDGTLALVYNQSSASDATERRLSLYDEIDDTGLAESAPEPPPEHGPGAAFWGAPRAPMTLALSADGGRSWPYRRDLEVGDGYCLTNNSRDGLNREFSYPSIQQGPDGALHIAFTYFRQAIKYVRVEPDWVRGDHG